MLIIFQLIQYATNSDKIASPHEDVWFKGSSHDLENFLYLIKEKRNLVGHKNKKITNLDDGELENVFSETKQQINKIIEQAGQKANIDAGEVDRVKKSLEDSIEKIRSIKLITSFDIHRILKFLKEDIEDSYSMELEDYFTGELKGFTAPNLRSKSDNSVSNLKDILKAIEKCQVAIISGEAGCGKTSLTR